MLKVFYALGTALLVTSVARSAEPPRLAQPPKINQTVSQPVPVTRYVTQATYRAPVGHTHTCANGHTWDHSVTDSHTCPVAGCNLQQWTQDSYPRSVNTGGVTSYVTPAGYSTPFATSGVTSGCVGGNCPTASYSSGRTGIFRRR